MSNVKEVLAKILEIEGAIGACLVDSTNGMMLGARGGGNFNLELAAAGNTEVVRAKSKTMKSLALGERIEDILITLENQYQIIRLLGVDSDLFLYLVLERNRANLAMARMTLAECEKEIEVH